jgi:hypothetical protein
MKNQLLVWETLGVPFIILLGSFLHFAFELSNFWKPVAVIAAVNESTWEHLKMVFWPDLVFSLLEYNFLKGWVSNFWIAKLSSLLIMPLIIAFGWYGIVAIAEENIFIINIVLFIAAIVLGQWVSYQIMKTNSLTSIDQRVGIAGIMLLTLAFGLFTFFPPKIFLFEHIDLMNTGEYGILDNYEDLLGCVDISV